MARYCLLLDLIDDPESIARYRAWHEPGQTPEAVIRSIRSADITAMEIYQLGDRLVMIMETGLTFSPEAKAAADASDPDIRAWEALMEQFQKATPWAAPGQKWTPAERIFELAQH